MDTNRPRHRIYEVSTRVRDGAVHLPVCVPARPARAALLAEWGRCRWLWNEAVHQQRTGRKPTFGKLSKLLTEARGPPSWLRDGSQVAQQQTLRTYALPFSTPSRSKGRGRPRVKTVEGHPAQPRIHHPWVLDPRRPAGLPGGVSIPVVWSRELPSDPTSVRVYQDSLGYWYASFVRHAASHMPAARSRRRSASTGASRRPRRPPTPLRPAAPRPPQTVRRRTRQGATQNGPPPPAQGVKPVERLPARKRQAAKVAKKAARQNTHDARAWAKKVVDNHA